MRCEGWQWRHYVERPEGVEKRNWSLKNPPVCKTTYTYKFNKQSNSQQSLKVVLSLGSLFASPPAITSCECIMYLIVIVNKRESQDLLLCFETSHVHKNLFQLTAMLTANPINFSEFQRTSVDKHGLHRSNKPACEVRSSGLGAEWESSPKSPRGGYVPSGFFVLQ